MKLVLSHLDLAAVWPWLILALLLVGLVVGWWQVRRLRWFVEALMDAARRMARGDLSVRVDTQGPFQMGELAASLNRMARQLDDRLSTVVQQRNELGAVLSSMQEGVLAIDLEERVLSVNRAASGLLGIEGGRIIGRLLAEAVRNTTLQALVRQTLEKGSGVQGETTLRMGESAEDGVTPADRYVQVQTASLRDAEGGRQGVLVVLHDVTALRRLESVRRDFVANVSHEVKTPVSAIKAAVETMLDDPELPRAQGETFMAMIKRQADRLDAIVEDLLSLARLENQQGELLAEVEVQPVGEVGRVVRAAIETCQAKADEKSIALVYELAGGGGSGSERAAQKASPSAGFGVEGAQDGSVERVGALVNAMLLEQALVNLIDNAVKYSPPETRVLVGVERVDEEVVVSVVDEGRGIEPRHLARVFERFYRTDRARSRELGGTGLGLSIVKHVAETMGGRVSVDSLPGEGSTFRVHLLTAELPAGRAGAGSASVESSA
ncbi:MAG: ATP-binding protein [Planctomycetota bacterium]